MPEKEIKNNESQWYKRLHIIIFEADSKQGKTFDVSLLILIVLSVGVVMLDSIPSVNQKYGYALFIAEWFFTIIFTIEYILRIVLTKRPSKYIFSFYGIIDLLAILPTYLSMVLAGSHFLLFIRILRLLRVFRVLKLVRFVKASAILGLALKNSRHKIIVFLEVVMTLVIIVGSLMYLIEGPENGFTSIPKSIYWAIVTITTVGYGDVAPNTVLGQTLASMLMIIGYAILAVPTGIMSVEIAKAGRINTQVCQNCNCDDHADNAKYCKNCGDKL